MLPIMKQLEAASTLVHKVHFLLAACLQQCQGNAATHRWRALAGQLASCLTFLTRRSLCRTNWYIFGTLRRCSREVEAQRLTNIVDDSWYTSDLFWYCVQIVKLNIEVELHRTFQTYKHLFALVVPQHDISQLAAEFVEYQAYALKEIVAEPYFSAGCMYQTGPFFHIVHWIFWPFPYSARMLKGIVNVLCYQQEWRAAVTGSNIANCTCT